VENIYFGFFSMFKVPFFQKIQFPIRVFDKRGKERGKKRKRKG
jgi:hypothetical protein